MRGPETSYWGPSVALHKLHVVSLLEGLRASWGLGAEKYLMGALGFRGLEFRVSVWPCARFKVQPL